MQLLEPPGKRLPDTQLAVNTETLKKINFFVKRKMVAFDEWLKNISSIKYCILYKTFLFSDKTKLNITLK